MEPMDLGLLRASNVIARKVSGFVSPLVCGSTMRCGE